MLTAMQGGLLPAQWAVLDFKEIGQAVAEIKEVAKGMGISVQVCGNLKRCPTVILRTNEFPDQWLDPLAFPPTQTWLLRLASVYGTSGYQVTHIAPGNLSQWWPASQAPASLVDAVHLDLQHLTLSGCSNSQVWDVMHGKTSTLQLGQSELTVWENRQECVHLQVKLPQAIPAQKTHRAQTHARVDLKWCVFPESRATWEEQGFAHVVEILDLLIPGQTLTILSAPSKECRRGRIHIQRTGAKAWKISGAISCDWDSLSDLADTLGVCFDEDVGYQPSQDNQNDQDEEYDLSEHRKRFLRDYNERNRTNYTTVIPLHHFHESVPMLWDTADPGTEHQFDRNVRGDVDHLLAIMSKLEDLAMDEDQRIWSDLESAYRPSHQPSQA